MSRTCAAEAHGRVLPRVCRSPAAALHILCRLTLPAPLPCPPAGALLFTTIVLSGFVEFKRLNDIRNPGSQVRR